MENMQYYIFSVYYFKAEETLKNKQLIRLSLSIFISMFIILAGCAGKKQTKKQLAKQGLLNSFETLPSDKEIGDFELETNGYVKLKQYKKYASKGRHSCMAVFTVPSDFLSEEETAEADSWIAPVTMSIRTLTRLKVTDWSPYRGFGVDIYVPDKKTRTFYAEITDVNGKKHIYENPIKPGKNRLKMKLEEAAPSRLDTTNIVSISFYLDTKGETKDVTLFMDNIRLIP